MSSVTDLVERLRALAGRFPLFGWDKPPVFGEPMTSSQIGAAREAGAEIFPPDFVEFLQVCGRISAADVHSGYFVGGLEHVGKAPQSGIQEACLIGSDGGGNQFVLVDGRVFKWVRETDRLEHIADSFLQFLERVVLDWQCYIEGAEGHEYLSG